ncbi:hypothetical protein T10_7858 [Trichinella papuae]|uniref:Uncharacterized protein n=1 Tax=Trichinella papuae TaxID=268474 RepID=A0A0V1M6J0_9BILA|nr:hypothetical protein T10_7858 [Trichinella papuae]
MRLSFPLNLANNVTILVIFLYDIRSNWYLTWRVAFCCDPVSNEEDPNSEPPKNLLESASCCTMRFMYKRNYDNATIED